MTKSSCARSAGGTLLACILWAGACVPSPEAAAVLPEFDVDPEWPQPLPENWIMGPVTGLFVDARDHVWVAHATDMLDPGPLGAAQDPPIADCCTPAPAVIEFDPEGNVVQAWDTESDEYAWPDVPHGIFVDHNDFVWIGSRPHHQVLKFTRDGELVLAIGEQDANGGSNDPDRLGMPAGIWVDPGTNEAFVADGYRNRRVVVYDGETGEYLRHWGAYGERPDDDVQTGPDDPDAEPARQFATVHGITGSLDGLIYVADRRNNRIQVFRPDGEFVEEVFARRGTLASGSAFDIALSPAPEQEFLYLADGTNHKIWVFRRDGLEVVGEFGRGGRQIGQFLRPHMMGTDSRGNIFVGEADNSRVQRFAVRGEAIP